MAFAGTAVWIWNLHNCDGGDYDQIATRCKNAGVRWAFLKSDDSGYWFPQADAEGPVPFWKACYELQRRGLLIAAWGYHTGAPRGTVLNNLAVAGPLEEMNRAVETITFRPNGVPDYRGPDGYIFDVEIEYEGRSGTAETMLRGVRASIPSTFILGYAPLPIIEQHLALPYRQFADAGCFAVPQTYYAFPGWGVQFAVSGWFPPSRAYRLDSLPCFPAYIDADGASCTDADFALYLSSLIAEGVTGLSCWSFEHMNTARWARLAHAGRVLGLPLPPARFPVS